MESDKDKLSRLEMMVNDKYGKWDLSNNDIEAIKYAIEKIKSADRVSGQAETLVMQGVPQPVLRTDIEEKYNELIMAVAKKFTNETRHETALRYIKEAENFNDNSCVKNDSEQSA